MKQSIVLKIRLLIKKNEIMRNLIVSFCTVLCFGIASAQEAPAKKRQSTDTVHNSSKHTTQKSSNSRKSDTVSKQRTDQKKSKTVKSKRNTNSTTQDKDSIRTP